MNNGRTKATALPFLTQPPVFFLASLTSMCERFGFYVLSFTLTIYLKSIYQYTDSQAFVLFGTFTALAYLTPALGGYLADNFIGIRRSIILGLFLEAFGLNLLAINTTRLLPISLALIILGVGFFKTGPTNLMARSYKENDPRLDSGFTLFYMLMNIGSFLTPIATNVVKSYYGWHMAFLAAAIALYISLIIYFIMRKFAASSDALPGQKKLPLKYWNILAIGLAATITLLSFLTTHATISHYIFSLATAILFFYFFYEIIKSNKTDKYRIIACLALILIGFAFFVLYFQAYTSMSLFIKRSVTQHLLGIPVSAPTFLSINSLWILILSPILAWMYNYLGKHKKDLSVTTKFPLGLLIVSLCFLLLKLSTYFPDTAGKVSGWWIIFALGIYSLGELLISALGVAMVARIAPKRMYGVMMGAWFLIASALGASASGFLADIACIPKMLTDPMQILHIYGNSFLYMGLFGLAVSAISFMIAPYIKKIASLE